MEKKKFIVYYENGELLEVLYECSSIAALVGYLLGILEYSIYANKLRIETK